MLPTSSIEDLMMEVIRRVKDGGGMVALEDAELKHMTGSEGDHLFKHGK